MTSDIVLSTEEFNVVGGRPIRRDGTDKVTGRAWYGVNITNGTATDYTDAGVAAGVRYVPVLRPSTMWSLAKSRSVSVCNHRTKQGCRAA